MKHILNSMFLQDVITNIEDKYKDIINIDSERYFMYSNVFDLPLYYNLFSYKNKPDYGLFNKIHEAKHYEIIMFLIKEIPPVFRYDTTYILPNPA